MVEVEATTSTHDAWRPLLRFDFAAGNLLHPGNYISYSNDPAFLTAEEQAQAKVRLDQLRSTVPTPPAE